MLYIDLHTHHTRSVTSAIEVVNVYEGFSSLVPHHYCSMGLHPWYIKEKDWKNEFRALCLASRNKNVIAIGECGLDRLCKVSFELQEQVFLQHIRWSNEIGKPLIVHQVRSHQRVLQLLEEQKHRQPIIFHGANHKHILELVRYGAFLSFGTALLKPRSSAHRLFAHVPDDQYFLETDNDACTIEELYAAAAVLKNTTVENIATQLEHNFYSIFAR